MLILGDVKVNFNMSLFLSIASVFHSFSLQISLLNQIMILAYNIGVHPNVLARLYYGRRHTHWE